jgi:DnaJ-class molecular chaperone
MKINKDLNYYKILNVEWTSDKTQIKKSYRDLSKKHHPDKNGGDDTLFTKISEAYKILTTDGLRNEYDENSQFGKSYNEDNELYNFEFSNESVEVSEYKSYFDKFKKKELVDILVKLNEFTNNIEYERLVSCKKCDGSGQDFSNDDLIFECDLCEGSGEWKDEKCPSCNGHGESSLQKCGSCEGEKLIEIIEKIKLKKSNFKDNKCKVEFRGNASKTNQGKVGHLYIIIEEE